MNASCARVESSRPWDEPLPSSLFWQVQASMYTLLLQYCQRVEMSGHRIEPCTPYARLASSPVKGLWRRWASHHHYMAALGTARKESSQKWTFRRFDAFEATNKQAGSTNYSAAAIDYEPLRSIVLQTFDGVWLWPPAIMKSTLEMIRRVLHRV